MFFAFFFNETDQGLVWAKRAHQRMCCKWQRVALSAVTDDAHLSPFKVFFVLLSFFLPLDEMFNSELYAFCL